MRIEVVAMRTRHTMASEEHALSALASVKTRNAPCTLHARPESREL